MLDDLHGTDRADPALEPRHRLWRSLKSGRRNAERYRRLGHLLLEAEVADL